MKGSSVWWLGVISNICLESSPVVKCFIPMIASKENCKSRRNIISTCLFSLLHKISLQLFLSRQAWCKYLLYVDRVCIKYTTLFCNAVWMFFYSSNNLNNTLHCLFLYGSEEYYKLQPFENKCVFFHIKILSCIVICDMRLHEERNTGTFYLKPAFFLFQPASYVWCAAEHFPTSHCYFTKCYFRGWVIQMTAV